MNNTEQTEQNIITIGLDQLLIEFGNFILSSERDMIYTKYAQEKSLTEEELNDLKSRVNILDLEHFSSEPLEHAATT